MVMTMNMNASLPRAALVSAVATITLLLVPAVGMQLGDSVNWGPGDFLIAALLLFGAFILVFLLAQRARTRAGRWIMIASVFTGLALIWAELAVGVFR